MALSVKNMLGGSGKVEFKNALSLKAKLTYASDPVEKMEFANYYTFLYGGNLFSNTNTANCSLLIKLSETLGVVASFNSNSYYAQFRAFSTSGITERPYARVGSATYVEQFYYTNCGIDYFKLDEHSALVGYKITGTAIFFFKIDVADDLSISVTQLGSWSDSTGQVLTNSAYFRMVKISEDRFVVIDYDISNTSSAHFYSSIFEYESGKITKISNVEDMPTGYRYSWFVYPIVVNENLVLYAFYGSSLRVMPVYINGDSISYGTVIDTGFNELGSNYRFFVYKIKENIYHLCTQASNQKDIFYFEIDTSGDITVSEKRNLLVGDTSGWVLQRFDYVVKDGLLHILRGNSTSNSPIGISTFLYDENSGYTTVDHCQISTDAYAGMLVNNHQYNNAHLFSNNTIVYVARASSASTYVWSHQFNVVAKDTFASINTNRKRGCIATDDMTPLTDAKTIATTKYSST